jgi:hypothetical protein
VDTLAINTPRAQQLLKLGIEAAKKLQQAVLK